MSTYQIHVFISHSWAYSGHYDTLEDWIFKRRWGQGRPLSTYGISLFRKTTLFIMHLLIESSGKQSITRC